MALGGAVSRLTPSGMSNSASFSPFSIRSLLNLQEDTVKGQGKLPCKSTQVPSPCYPLVPRPVRAIASFPNLSLCVPNLRFPFGGILPLHPVAQMSHFPFPRHGFLLEMELFQRRKRRPLRKKKLRPLFSTHQVQTMEEEFAKSKYVTEKRRSELALQLNMTETQVKTWFQNRRTKWKKEKKSKSELTLPEVRDNYGEVMLQALAKRNMKCYGIPLVQRC